MTDDILLRLRSEGSLKGYYDVPALQREAAAEIERLRLYNANLRAALEKDDGSLTTPDHDALRAENARLREALKPFAGMRMSGEPHTTTLMWKSAAYQLREQADEMERRDAEIQRARAALNGGVE